MLSSDHAEARTEVDRHPALVDPLTGLASRLHFELVYGYMFAAGDRGMAFTVMLISCGAESDDEIKAVGRSVESTTRTSDLVSHVGDGRYVVLLLGTNLQGARIAADRIELSLGGLGPGAACFGLAAYAPEMKDSGDLLDAAERALVAAETARGGIEFA